MYRTAMVIVVAALELASPGRARADEADNFTCHARLAKDSLIALDGWMNARIQEAVAQANRRGAQGCDAACLFRALRETVGGSSPKRFTFIPRSRFGKWIGNQPDVERCHLKFGETIYGAKRYSQVWLFPFNHRIIFVSDSIRLSGRIVGLDKVDHFIREGLEHWRTVDRSGGSIAASIAREVGMPGHRFGWTEYGVKGMSLTGVFAYADLAAGYFGYRFWDDALSLGRADSFVAYDAASGRYAQRRTFMFAEYVNDAWDETVNCSVFHPTLGREVAEALKSRSRACAIGVSPVLSALPDARLYVNPTLLQSQK